VKLHSISIILLFTRYYCSDLGKVKFTDFHFGNMVRIVKSKRVKYIKTIPFLMLVHVQNMLSLLTNNKNVENMYTVHKHGSNIQTVVLPVICTNLMSQQIWNTGNTYNMLSLKTVKFYSKQVVYSLHRYTTQ
jgi:hypothetical protein